MKDSAYVTQSALEGSAACVSLNEDNSIKNKGSASLLRCCCCSVPGRGKNLGCRAGNLEGDILSSSLSLLLSSLVSPALPLLSSAADVTSTCLYVSDSEKCILRLISEEFNTNYSTNMATRLMYSRMR